MFIKDYACELKLKQVIFFFKKFRNILPNIYPTWTDTQTPM